MARASRSEHYRREVSRVEGFSDAVFAFAITLLVVSLEVPKTFEELMAAIRAFPAFAVCFALLFQVWWRHYRFFRSYDLEDGPVIAMTGLLLFVVLFYVYPLKFLWSMFFAQFDPRLVDIKPCFAQQHVGKQAAAHADLAMNAPDREFDALLIEGFAPRQHVLIDAVDQRSIQVKQKRCLMPGRHDSLPIKL